MSTFSIESSGGLFAPIFQPAFGMSCATAFLLVTTQSVPRVFLPQRWVGTRISGVKAQRWISLPLAGVSMLYAGAADQIANGSPVRGHVGGYILSMVCAGGCMLARNLSGWWWFMAFVYGTFGQMHHARRLTQLTDGASWYNKGDFAVMREWRRMKQGSGGRTSLAA
jgi:hypothetical protein